MPTSGQKMAQARHYYLLADIQHGNFEAIIPILQGLVKKRLVFKIGTHSIKNEIPKIKENKSFSKQ